MTVIKCKDCTWHYTHNMVAELFRWKEKHESQKQGHIVEFYETLSSALLGLGQSKIVYRGVCNTCLQYYDARTRISAESRVRTHQENRNKVIAERDYNTKGSHRLVRRVARGLPNPPEMKGWSETYRDQYRYICSCGCFDSGYSDIKAEWEFDRHVKQANKRLEQRLAEGDYKKHEGLTIHEIPWEDYVSTDTGDLAREIKQWKKQMEEEHITTKEFSDLTQVERGNDEVAFWLRSSGRNNYNEIFIAVQLMHKCCPHSQRCKYQISAADAVFHKKGSKSWNLWQEELKHPFKALYEHFLNHYDPEQQGHEEFENVAYAMLQQFVILETNRRKGRRGPHSPLADRAASAIHEIIKTFGIPTQLVTNILGTTYRYIADHYYRGIYLSKEGIPEWVKNVTSPSPDLGLEGRPES